MESIFRVPWATLELADVEAFVESASGEGLVWEAKGQAPLRGLKKKIVEAVCGLANQLGGFVIVGAEAERSDGPWLLSGVENDAGEDAHDWICRVLNGRLSNPPPFDVRRWTLSDSKVVAVIRVDPVGVAPCMTIDGLVWQRLVSETRKINDPLVLLELIRRGQAAREVARERAREAVDRGRVAPLVEGGQEVARVVLALAPVVSLEDISSRLFRDSFKELLSAAAGVLELATADWRRAVVPSAHRDGYVVRLGKPESERWGWAIQAAWNGTVCVELAAIEESSPPTLNTIIEQAWRAASSLLPHLTGIEDELHVPTHLAVAVNSGGIFTFEWPGHTQRARSTSEPIERWATMAAPSGEELESVYREIARTMGIDALEP